jgi:hypothetical protein
MRSRVAALATDSQYAILPLVGMTTTSPGSEEEAEAETKHPSGSGSDVCFEGDGSANVKVSGEGMLIVYGQTNAWE